MHSITAPNTTRSPLRVRHSRRPLRTNKLTPGFEGQLHSTFALDQLTALAKRIVPAQFVLTMASTFGFDIPAHTYFKLYQSLHNGDVEHPQIQLVSSSAHRADYDNRDRVIRLHAAEVEHVLDDPRSSWELLEILLHEFGHHLDNFLRQDLADKHPDGSATVADDAHLEEGSRHVQRMALFESLNTDEIEIANYTAPGKDTVNITACYACAMQMIREAPAGCVRHPQNTDRNREGFEAGDGGEHTFTHSTIEAVLAPLGFMREEVEMVYFGNWLRDYSQLLDPKIIRAGTMPKSFPDVLSREALTEIVDIISATRFSYVKSLAPNIFRATPELLGVYRPCEHIDNPKVVEPQPADPKTRDADFEPWVLPGDPSLEVDPETSMKRYIQRSVRFMQEELKTSMFSQRSAEGLIKFGSGLHVLEDFFAHSNFVELSLIKLGYADVLPWTSKADCKWGLPLVTGMFGGTDVVASLAAPLAEKIFSTADLVFEPSKAGVRTERDRIMLVLLKEHQDPVFLNTFEQYLEIRDKWADLPWSEFVEKYLWITSLPLQVLGNAYGTVMQGVLKLAGNSVDDYQTLFGDDPNTSGSTDPSHSQLSKDHGEHPLHTLASLLAQEAVKTVAQTMTEQWSGQSKTNPATVAAAYFAHPMDTVWQDAIVKEWAIANPDLIRRSASKNELDKIHDQLRESANQGLKKLEKDGKDLLKFLFDEVQNEHSFLNILLRWTPAGQLQNNIKKLVVNKQ
jgi:hypothetical protein